MKLSQTITEIRKDKGFTQEEFAKEFNVTRQTVSNWENEKSYPDLLTLIRISDTYGYSLDRMLKEDYDMTEAMNKSIEAGKKYKVSTRTELIISAIGFLCTGALVIISFAEHKGIGTALPWIACAVLDLILFLNALKFRKTPDADNETARCCSRLSGDDVNTVKYLCSHDMRTEAVKLVRKITGIGLVEAKTLVDEMSVR